MITCQQSVGCFLDKINCVSGHGSNSYLSKGKLSITMGSWLTQENLTVGWAHLGGYYNKQTLYLFKRKIEVKLI